MKKFNAVILALLLAMYSFFGVFTISSAADTEYCPDISGNNLNSHEYPAYYTDPITSYLVPTSDGGLMRFQSGAAEGKYLAEYVNADYETIGHKLIDEELPLFGGFYFDGSNYYVVSGQTNFAESATVECFRITKYDLNWNRIKSVGLSDCNTTIPFDAGTVRFDHEGKYIIIRTSHEMYTSSDGYNHQANVTIQLDSEAMVITDSLTDVAAVQAGYFSHSFNQFVKIDNGKIVALDHGDAHLRSLAVIKYPNLVSSGSFRTWNCEYTEALIIPGEYGENYTGVEAGGFEISDSSYLVAYASVDLDENFRTNKTFNVYVAAVNKTANAVTTTEITMFEEGEGGGGCPHLVKINDNRFMLLWQEQNGIAYTAIDGEGKIDSEIKFVPEVNLSDCQPIVYNDEIVWYTYTDENTVFYRIDLNDMSSSENEITSGHDITIIQKPSYDDPYCSVKCDKCGHTENIKVSYDLTVYWNTASTGTYSTAFGGGDFNIGDKIYIYVPPCEDETVNDKIEIITSNGTTLGYSLDSNGWGSFRLTEGGSYDISVRYKYNPDDYISISVDVATGSNPSEGSSPLLGDVNQNGKIDARDYVLLKRAYFKTASLNEEQKLLGDINQNGDIDARDYVTLKRIYFGTYKL